MFSQDIICSEEFTAMPLSSQALYVHLAIKADDDGFVQPRQIMRMINASDDDLKILIAKRFILAFDGGVVVIKHWLIHNIIRGDRYKQTRFLEQKKLLKIKENKAYTEINKLGMQNGNQMATNGRHRLDKIRLDKDRVDIVASDKLPAPFSLKEEIKKLEDSPRRDLNIIALYFEQRGTDLQNMEQYHVALRRHLKPAGALKSFTDKQILKAIDYAKKEYKDIWTLETLTKILTK